MPKILIALFTSFNCFAGQDVDDLSRDVSGVVEALVRAAAEKGTSAYLSSERLLDTRFRSLTEKAVSVPAAERTAPIEFLFGNLLADAEKVWKRSIHEANSPSSVVRSNLEDELDASANRLIARDCRTINIKRGAKFGLSLVGGLALTALADYIAAEAGLPMAMVAINACGGGLSIAGALLLLDQRSARTPTMLAWQNCQSYLSDTQPDLFNIAR